jgi:hypothetical protein
MKNVCKILPNFINGLNKSCLGFYPKKLRNEVNGTIMLKKPLFQNNHNTLEKDLDTV